MAELYGPATVSIKKPKISWFMPGYCCSSSLFCWYRSYHHWRNPDMLVDLWIFGSRYTFFFLLLLLLLMIIQKSQIFTFTVPIWAHGLFTAVKKIGVACLGLRLILLCPSSEQIWSCCNTWWGDKALESRTDLMCWSAGSLCLSAGYLWLSIGNLQLFAGYR